MEKIIVQNQGSPGLLAGIFGCVFGILGIVTWGLIFVPLAVLCSIVGLVRGISGSSASGIGTSCLAAVLAVIGFVVSPSLWVALGIGFLVHTATTNIQQSSYPPLTPTQISREDRTSFVNSAYSSCVKTQTARLTETDRKVSGVTDEQISDYCRCAAKKAGDVITPAEVRYIEENHTIPPSFQQKTASIAQACRQQIQ